VLSAGPGACVGGFAAAHEYRFLADAPSTIDIVAPRQMRPRNGVRCAISSTLSEHDVHATPRGNITSPARTLLDLAGRMDAYDLARVIREARFRRKFVLADVADVMGRNFGRHELQVLAEALLRIRQGSAGSRSRLERRGLALIVRASLEVPRLNTKVNFFGHALEPDLLWPDRRLVIEIDGPPHDWESAELDDEAFDTLMRCAGYTVIHAHESTIDHAGGRAFVRIVRQALQAHVIDGT
jgi:very-short-patch-repair endonuclease